LGLSQVYGIVSQHQGHATVESRMGQGTTFAIYLPPLEAKKKPPTAELVQMKQGQGETILLVEDEPIVLAVTTAMLKQLGYQVLVASNGKEAVVQFEVHQAQLALVISDMVMPDMDGAELFHRLKAKTPQVKMVIMSGYPLGGNGATLLEQGVVAWLKKPMSFEQLSQAIGKALSKRKGRWG
jgi:two-component system, cell cycle sensor histidine kinase and response regulator CckA